MALNTIVTVQNFKQPKERIWDFISSPNNLKKITPEYMGFDIISQNLEEKIYAGMIIQYQVKPLFGIGMNWVTEITHVDHGKYFIDEQRFGPYRFWHHTHKLIEISGGVKMIDEVNYTPPFGLLGTIANAVIIKHKLNEIFEYRRLRLIEQFGDY